MAKKKSDLKKIKKQKRSWKDIGFKVQIQKSIIGLVILVLAAVVLAHFLIKQKQSVKPAPVKQKVLVKKHTACKIPAFEIYPREKSTPLIPVLPPKELLKKELPKVAIIIDDIGYDKAVAAKFLALDAVFTFSVLPCSPFQKFIAQKARSKGMDIMLHLPMEPIEYPMVNPGPGALFVSMSPDQLIDQLNKDLDAVPYIKGVNNHMGSRMTTISTKMYQIFSILKKRGLFFIDSRTTSESLCKPSARLLLIPFAQRDVFLDHIQNPEVIRRQIDRLIHIAQVQKKAVGIAHPHMVTYEVLREKLPYLKKKVRLVSASHIVRINGIDVKTAAALN
ncbi:MAG TPA: divergent polysaccharide deacetylase family protein [Desulfobacteraceae bacterium]|nr:divergent polysaccharide deacetylase family protein [Desulfobacteraceae bacterium]